MATLDPIWRGTRDASERMGSPVLRHTGNGWTATRIYDGDFQKLIASSPAIGAHMSDLGNMEVEEVEITPMGGGAGTMTVKLVLNTQALTQQPEDFPIYEIDWIEVQRDITLHQRYQAGGDDELSDEEFICLKKARQGDAAARQKITSNYYQDDSLTAIWHKICAGEESYAEYFPVVNETVITRLRPTENAEICGVIDTPPGASGAPQGYQWLRTGYPVTQQGLKWTRKRQWTGAWWIDPDLYDSTR